MINKEEVEKIAKLARIELTEEEIKRFQKDFSDILDYFKLLKKVNTSKINPTCHSSEEYFKGVEATREDVVSAEEENVEGIIKLFPRKEGRHLRVKSVLS